MYIASFERILWRVGSTDDACDSAPFLFYFPFLLPTLWTCYDMNCHRTKSTTFFFLWSWCLSFWRISPSSLLGVCSSGRPVRSKLVSKQVTLRNARKRVWSNVLRIEKVTLRQLFVCLSHHAMWESCASSCCCDCATFVYDVVCDVAYHTR